jgi:hypothetical protein
MIAQITRHDTIPTLMMYNTRDASLSEHLDIYRCQLPSILRACFVDISSSVGVKAMPTRLQTNVYCSASTTDTSQQKDRKAGPKRQKDNG